ncbi:MAG: hypothetical protein PHC69_08275 [Ruminiclostridium sp.]|nr:hypothetical protein [Ruminiclostridium sp.]
MVYSISFQLANEEKAKVVDLKDYTNEFKAAFTDFNKSGEKARNRRKIIEYSITFNTLYIKFESDVELTNPTKSFRNFSKYLIDNTDFKDFVINKRLLKGVEVKPILDEKEMSDEQMLKILLNWCLSKDVEDANMKKTKRTVIDKIKVLLCESQM